MRIGASRQLGPSLNFYRVKNAYSWMQPVERRPLVGTTYDYYLLLPQDQGVVTQLGLRPVEKDPLSGTLLAVPAGS